ncbi:hypothetical protein ACFYYR_15585 [Streptomyces sp. NPDC001922]|uniref:hypothetical protein n=1 Tax=Streptomyces sp. NPDC001922 TaxID=3364624 RepID=UPI00368B0268
MTTDATTEAVTRVTEGFTAARTVADAVLFEGYVLYPYRASAGKNRMRWQFGVLVPPGWGEAAGEHSGQRTDCLFEPKSAERLLVELRFLRVRRRTVERLGADGRTFTGVPELELPDRVVVPWDEGVTVEIACSVPLAELAGGGRTETFHRPGSVGHEPVRDDRGRTLGRMVRELRELHGEIRLVTEPVPGPYGALRLIAEVRNTAPWTPGGDAGRDAALPHSAVAAHLLLGLPGGRFLSMADPPEWARPAAESCRNEHTWPVPAGAGGRDDVLLSSPIILEDHPRIAEESPGALYDATEIDEILSLRTAALTDREKREARGTDDRAADVIDLVDGMPAAVLERLHGAVRGLHEVTDEGGGTGPRSRDEDTDGGRRSHGSTDAGTGPAGTPRPSSPPGLPTGPGLPWWDPGNDPGADPARDAVMVSGRAVRAGSRVLLHPGLRHTDAQDMFLSGRSATVEAVLGDVDGEVHIAVVVDGDPGADVRRDQGRFLYFKTDEVEPLDDPPPGAADGPGERP